MRIIFWQSCSPEFFTGAESDSPGEAAAFSGEFCFFMFFEKNCKKVLTDIFFCGNLIELSEIIVSENMKN